MKKIQLFTLFALLFLFNSCTKEEDFSDNADLNFFLKSDGAILPIEVNGNTNSKTFVIIIHGGPADDSSIYLTKRYGVFEGLYQDYAFVYYDQRCAGLSQGNCDPEQISLAKSTDDLNKVINLIKHKFGDDISVFVHGHSWGSTLSMSYLTTDDFQHNINGAFLSAGPHSLPFLFSSAKQNLIDFSDRMISENILPEKWEALKMKVEDEDPTTYEGAVVINNTGHETEAILIEMDSIKEQVFPTPPSAIRQLGDYLPYFINWLTIESSETFYDEFLQIDLSDQLSEIEIPTAVFGGRYDFAVPPVVINECFDLIGSQNKTLKIFDQSHHGIMVYENDLYLEEMKNFIELYK